MEVLPGWAPTRTLRALSQPWEGDVTMVLPDSLAQLRGALLTPSRAQMAAAARMVSQLLRRDWRMVTSLAFSLPAGARAHLFPLAGQEL